MTRRSKGSIISNEDSNNGDGSSANGSWDDDDVGSGSGKIESFEIDGGYGYGPKRRNHSLTSWHSRSQSSNEESISPVETPLTTQYTILTFSTCQSLEDNFQLSWYNLRAYELLEIHRVNHIVRLPREVMVQYVKPYFEARVKSLRRSTKGETSSGINLNFSVTESFGSGKSIKVKMSKGSKTDLQQSSDPMFQGHARGKDSTKKKKRVNLEWRERWVVVYQGQLRLCRDRTVSLYYSSFRIFTSINIWNLGSKSIPVFPVILLDIATWRRTLD